MPCLDVIRTRHHLFFAIQIGLLAAMHLGVRHVPPSLVHVCLSFARPANLWVPWAFRPVCKIWWKYEIRCPWSPVHCVLPCWVTRPLLVENPEYSAYGSPVGPRCARVARSGVSASDVCGLRHAVSEAHHHLAQLAQVASVGEAPTPLERGPTVELRGWGHV